MSLLAAYRSPARRWGRSLANKLKRLIWGGGARGDLNSRKLDDRFLSHGCSLVKLDKVGDGVPDRIVGFGRVRDFFVEYKNPDGRGRWEKARPSQVRFRDHWLGRGVVTAMTEQDVDLIVERFKAG